MTVNLFYSVLKYRHGLVLGESLNAGILFYDLYSDKFSFESGDLKRIACSYPGLKAKKLSKYTEVLKENIKKSNQSNIFKFEIDNLQEFISKELLYSDAAGLSFDPIETVPVPKNNDIEKTINYLKQLFLIDLNAPIGLKRKRNEEYIISEVFHLLKKKSPGILNKVERNHRIQTPLIEFIFDFFWKSDSNHLTKALSFDLESHINIQNKALQIYGALEQLEVTFKNQFGPFEIDFLVAKPSDKNHFKEFDNAIKIIENSKISSNFSFEDEWYRYVDLIIETADEIDHIKQ